jgi:H+-translocating NAD(P) transhydrogenase subunit beta
MIPIIIDFSYIIGASLFIIGVKLLSKVVTARRGNFLAALGMLLVIVVTLLDKGIVNYQMILVGIIIGALIGGVTSKLVQMTAMPQMVGLFNGFGGIASALVACSEFLRNSTHMSSFTLTTIMLGTFVGAITFTGSLIAFGKLQGIVTEQPVTYPLQKTINLLLTIACLVLGVWLVGNPEQLTAYWALLFISSALGILLVLPIGGADMPVVISLLNSYSGVAAAMTGFVLMNKVLIVAGSLVGAAGIILTQIMCRAMNRSLANVAFGTFGKIETTGEKGKGARDYANVKSCQVEEAAMMLTSAQQVIVVPGYGLAVARAQHVLRDLASILEGKGVTVKYAIHPVAGRMPGHMNVLLAEAEVPYDKLFEMDTINREFSRTDVALVIGANDVTNPAARNEKGSPIYGMPILNVDQAQSTIVIKRSLSPGFAGIKNPLFENAATTMLFGDAKAMLEQLVKEIEQM